MKIIKRSKINWLIKIQTDKKWRIENIFFALLLPCNSRSLYLLTFGVITNRFKRNPKKIKIERILGNIINSWNVKAISAPDMTIPKINNLGKKALKKACDESLVKTVNTIGVTSIIKDIMTPNKEDAKKFTIILLPW